MKKLFFAVLMLSLIVFPAAAKSIVVTSPAAGTLWQVGTHQTLSWTATGFAATAKFRAVLFQSGVKVDIIVENLAIGAGGHGTYDWIAGQHLTGNAGAGTGYTIKVRDMDGTVVGESGTFSLSNALQPSLPSHQITLQKPENISLAPLRITKPKAGDVLDPYNGGNIEWSKSGTQDANVSVTLLRSGAPFAVLAASTPNSGYYIWNPQPLNPDPGSYTVRVRTLDGACEDTSQPFTMSEAGGIKILSPAGGEAWVSGSSHAVTWQRLGNIRTVTILLTRPDSNFQMTLAQNVDAKLLTKTCTFSKNPQDGGDPVCYQVTIVNSLNAQSDPTGCFNLAWPGSPDLAIENVVFYPSAFHAGTSATITITVKNIGTAPSASCQGDLRLNDAVQKTFSVPSIGTGQTRSVDITWTEAGGHFKITVDTGNANPADPNKANNVWQRDFYFRP